MIGDSIFATYIWSAHYKGLDDFIGANKTPKDRAE